MKKFIKQTNKQTNKQTISVIILLFFILISTGMSWAQIKVISNGNVGIGNTSPAAKLDVNGDTKLDELDVSGQARIMSSSWTGGIVFDNSATWGLATIRPASSSDGSWLGTSSYPFHTAYVKYVYAYSMKTEYMHAVNHYVGTGYTFSDERIKSNIRDIENPMQLLNNIKGKKYDKKDPENGWEKNKDGNVKTKEEYGFIAQELSEVLPELTTLDTVTDLYAINYTALIPIIVEALKDQQAQIDELKAQVKSLEPKTKSAQSAVIDQTSLLKQNIPNPFNETTRIDMEISESVQNATLYIYNLQGIQIDEFVVNQRGNTSITIDGFTLEAGIYLYTLICDGMEVDTKKMILTK